MPETIEKLEERVKALEDFADKKKQEEEASIRYMWERAQETINWASKYMPQLRNTNK